MWWALFRWGKAGAVSCRECSRCKRAWPPNPDHAVCAFCGIKTTPLASRSCMSAEVAEKLLAKIDSARVDFEREWSDAEAIALAHGFDVYEVVVSKWHATEGTA